MFNSKKVKIIEITFSCCDYYSHFKHSRSRRKIKLYRPREMFVQNTRIIRSSALGTRARDTYVIKLCWRCQCDDVIIVVRRVRARKFETRGRAFEDKLMHLQCALQHIAVLTRRVGVFILLEFIFKLSYLSKSVSNIKYELRTPTDLHNSRSCKLLYASKTYFLSIWHNYREKKKTVKLTLINTQW